jgi:hypothetical protein
LQQGGILNVALYEGVVRAAFYVAQVLQVAGIGELVEVHDAVVRIALHKQPHHMRADEPGTSGDK